MLEITCNDRLGKKVRVKCNPDDTIGDLKKLIAAQTGTRYDKIVLKKWYTIYKDNIRLSDCEYLSTVQKIKAILHKILAKNWSLLFFVLDEIHDGMNLEMYYQ